MSAGKRSEFHVADNLDLSNVGKVEGLKRRGLMLVLSSPSGAGKTTLAKMLMKVDEDVTVSVSVTTRDRRPGEVNGQDYHFVTIPEFNKMVENEEFLEYAKVFGNYYGTPKKPVFDALANGRDVLFDIDWQGTQKIAEQARDDLVTCFILPPSYSELEKRLRRRAQDTEEVILKRMSEARQEMSHYFDYDYVLINRQLDDSLYKLRTILGAERMKRRRLVGLSDFVKKLREGL